METIFNKLCSLFENGISSDEDRKFKIFVFGSTGSLLPTRRYSDDGGISPALRCFFNSADNKGNKKKTRKKKTTDELV